MILLFMALFFAFVVFASALVFFPTMRSQFFSLNRQAVSHAASLSSGTRSKAVGIASVVVAKSLCQGAHLLETIKASRRALLILSAVLLLPPLVAISLNASRVPEYQEHGYVADSKVLELLKGEQLVPPVMLPPEVFVTREVELVRPMLADASRNWDLLDGEFRQRLLYVFKVMREQHGYEMALLEGYRTPERQANLQAHGAGVVTNAGAYQSYHQYGLASDCAFLREGKLVISEKDPWAMRGYELYGQVAESAGLTWGGRWKLMDFGHVELRRPGVLGKRN